SNRHRVRSRLLVVIVYHRNVTWQIHAINVVETDPAERIVIRRVQNRVGGELPEELPPLVARDVEQHLVEVAAVPAADDRAAVAADVVREAEPRGEVVVVALLLARLDRI